MKGEPFKKPPSLIRPPVYVRRAMRDIEHWMKSLNENDEFMVFGSLHIMQNCGPMIPLITSDDFNKQNLGNSVPLLEHKPQLRLPYSEMKTALCVPTEILVKMFGVLTTGFASKNSVPFTLEDIIDVADFGDRANLETDPNFKQLIPYIIVRKGNYILNYSRGKKGDESRLHATRSIGFGGHIEESDDYAKGIGPVEACILRELHDELGYTISSFSELKFLGYVNNEEDDVGKVHLGLVFDLVVPDDFEPKPDEEDGVTDLAESNSQTLDDRLESFEAWSKLLIDGRVWM